MSSDMGLYFKRTAIIGVGLIGASLALSMREKGLCETIIGYGRKEENLKRAKDIGIIDEYSLDAASAAGGSDLVVLCTPVGMFTDVAGRIKPALKKGALVTDVGSVKGCLVSELESFMPDGVYFIGSHPIAGGDKSGIDEARKDLFKGARCIVTPTARSDKDAVKAVVSLWESTGAVAEIMNPFKHDEIFALVSHLPHIVAYALVNAVGSTDPECIDYSGGGFRDTTRIAASSPELWRDISMMNRDNLLKVIESFRENLGRIEQCLARDDWEGIEKEFGRAQKLRLKLNNSAKSEQFE